ncbi:MAG: PAS domain-containing protein, partial [Dictyoglomaceae bacterium]
MDKLRERWHVLTEDAPIGILILNKNGYLVYANPKAKELLDILNNGSRKKLIEVI